MQQRFIFLLGSNVGDRPAQLAAAQEGLVRLVGPIDKQSSIYETAAWGKTDQDPFLNQIVSGTTLLDPESVMKAALQVETEMGRTRSRKWEPRTIDIDLLFLEQVVMHSDLLVLPHPMLHQRKFTLAPLCDIFPEFRHPVLGKTMKELLEELSDPLEVKPYRP
ncbi:MAG: 2-amino-4-hydroxy-6-hydroxymethyldihydropteridine diphosphokinase [Bacteroidota bacterium]